MVKELLPPLPSPTATARDVGLMPGLGRSSGVENGNPIPIFLPRKFHGQRNLAGFSPWGYKELDMTERLIFSLSMLSIC